VRKLVVALAVGSLAWLAWAAEPCSGGTLLAAHRGGALLWPENSLLAFRNAVALWADFLEFDVHLSKDGAVVVIHDPALERTTTGVGEVRNVTLAELRRVRLKDADGRETAEPVPTLDEVLDLAAPTRAFLLLEIKTAPRQERYEGIEGKVLGLLRARNLTGRTVIMSFHSGVVQRVRELAAAIRTSLLVSQRSLDRRGASSADAIGWATAAGATDIGFQYTMITPALLAAARDRGLRVGAWTVNDEIGIRRMVELGVDILITDRPDLAKELLRR